MKGVEISKFGSEVCCLKRYPHAETAQFKVFGSGYLNESFLPRALSADVPNIISHGQTPHDDYAYLELIKGTCRAAEALSCLEARACGTILGKINRQRGHWFGSLDGKYKYASWRESWIPRWKVMVRLLESVDRQLAERTASWGAAMLTRVDDTFNPFLVHGDYGPGNLIWTAGRCEPVVIDWEHARFGHPAEDWAKIFLAEIFSEANGFSSEHQSRIRAVWNGWVEAWGKESLREIFTVEVVTFLMAYFAGTLGVFLDGSRGGRMEWLRGVLLGEGEPVKGLLDAVQSD